MRLPVSKVYRAFPELDPFSDAQCAGYVRSAHSSGRPAWWKFCVMALVGWFVIFAGLFMLAAATAAWVRFKRSVGPAEFAAVAGALTVAVGVPTLLVVFGRDRWLRRAIAQHLRTSDCPACRYQLLGLPAIGGSVRCPECGAAHTLQAIGFTGEQWEAMLAEQENKGQAAAPRTPPFPGADPPV